MDAKILEDFSNSIDALPRTKFGGGYKTNEVENLFGNMLAELNEAHREIESLKSNTITNDDDNEEVEELRASLHKAKLDIASLEATISDLKSRGDLYELVEGNEKAELRELRVAKAKRDEEVAKLLVELETAKAEVEKIMNNTSMDASLISDTLIMATRTAEEWKAKAKAEGDSIIASAKSEANKIREDAKHKAGRIVSEANAKVSAVMESATVVSENFSKLEGAIKNLSGIRRATEEMVEMLR